MLAAAQRELDALGGGDTRIAHTQVTVRVRPSRLGNAASNAKDVVTISDNEVVILRDPRVSGNVPARQAFQEYNVTSALGPEATQSQVFASVGKEAVDWLWDGFNGCILSFGQVYSGKTHTMFASAEDSAPAFSEGLAPRILSQIFSRIESLPPTTGKNYKVGLSYIDVGVNEVVDLLRESSEGINSDNNLCVHVKDLTECLQILEVARTRSRNWHEPRLHSIRPLPNRAHSFLRITLLDTNRRRVSALHLIDLVGSQSLSANRNATIAHYQPHPDLERDRRNLNQHLLAFGRLISELAQRQDPTGQKPLPANVQIACARDSKLTQLLAPLLSGNCKSFLLPCISEDAEDYLDSTNTLRIASRAMVLTTACHRQLGFDAMSIPMASADDVVTVAAKEAARVAAQVTGALDGGGGEEQQQYQRRTSASNKQRGGERAGSVSVEERIAKAKDDVLRASLERLNRETVAAVAGLSSSASHRSSSGYRAKLGEDALGWRDPDDEDDVNNGERDDDDDDDDEDEIDQNRRNVNTWNPGPQEVLSDLSSNGSDDHPLGGGAAKKSGGTNTSKLARNASARAAAAANAVANMMTSTNISAISASSKMGQLGSSSALQGILLPTPGNNSNKLGASASRAPRFQNSNGDAFELADDSMMEEEDGEEDHEKYNPPRSAWSTSSPTKAAVSSSVNATTAAVATVVDSPDEKSFSYSFPPSKASVGGSNNNKIRTFPSSTTTTAGADLDFDSLKSSTRRAWHEAAAATGVTSSPMRASIGPEMAQKLSTSPLRHEFHSLYGSMKQARKSNPSIPPPSREAGNLSGFGKNSAMNNSDLDSSVAAISRGAVISPMSPPIHPRHHQQTANDVDMTSASHFQESFHPGTSTVDGIGSPSVLRRNYEALLQMFESNEQELRHSRLRLQDFEADMEEQRAAHDVQVQDLKEQLHQANQKIRKACENHNVASLFETYEGEINQLNARIAKMEADHVTLLVKMSDTGAAIAEQDEEGLRLKSAESVNSIVRKSLKSAHSQAAKARQETEELKKKLRAAEVQRRLMEDVRTRTNSLSRDVQHKEAELEQKTVRIEELRQTVEELNEELRNARGQVSILRAEIEPLREELVHVKRVNESLEKDRRRERLVFKFSSDSSPKRSSGVRPQEALHLCRRLEREVGASNPKCHVIIEKLASAIRLYEDERLDNERKQKDMLATLIEYQEKSAKTTRQMLRNNGSNVNNNTKLEKNNVNNNNNNNNNINQPTIPSRSSSSRSITPGRLRQ